MSSPGRNFSRESRSYYCRSSSFHDNSSSGSKFESNFDNRPLSRRLVERDSSNFSLSGRNDNERFNFDRRSKEIFDEFDRRRRRFLSASSLDDLFNDEFFNDDFANSSFQRKISLENRHDGFRSPKQTQRTIPVQFVQPTNDQQRTYERFEQRVHWNDNDQRRDRSNQRIYFISLLMAVTHTKSLCS